MLPSPPSGVVRETAASLASVFRNRNLRRVQLALLAALVGDTAFATAVTVWAYGVGGASAVGIFTAGRLVAAAVVAPLGAAVADRYDRRTVLLVTSLVRTLLVIAATVCLSWGPPLPVFLLAAAAGVLSAPFRSAQRAWMPALSAHPEELTAANATASTIESLAVFVGPALGGLLLVVAGVQTVFLLNVGLFVVSMLLILGVRALHPQRTPGDHEAQAAPGFVHELLAGFRALGTDSDLRVVTGQVCAQTFVGGASKVFVVVLAVDVMKTGARGVGLLDAVIGVGAIIGGFIALARSRRGRLARDLTAGVLLWSVPLGLIVLWPTPVTVIVTLVLLGVANPLVDVNLDTIVQRMTPESTLARVFGALDTCYIATSALGSLLVPFMLHLVGLRWTLLAIAAPVAVIALLSLRRMDGLDRRLRPPESLPLLRGISWLAPLAPGVLEPLARSLTPVDVPAGATVIREGEPADRFYVIESGVVEITQDGRVLRRQGPGEHFGEIALLHDVPRTATVTAVTDVRLQALDREPFLRVLSGDSLTAATGFATTRMLGRG